MHYLFNIEGLNREVWKQAETEKAARAALWSSLSDEEQNAVVQIECIGEKAYMGLSSDDKQYLADMEREHYEMLDRAGVQY